MEYDLFPLPGTDCYALLAEAITSVSEDINGFIWQSDPFNLHVKESPPSEQGSS